MWSQQNDDLWRPRLGRVTYEAEQANFPKKYTSRLPGKKEKNHYNDRSKEDGVRTSTYAYISEKYKIEIILLLGKETQLCLIGTSTITIHHGCAYLLYLGYLVFSSLD